MTTILQEWLRYKMNHEDWYAIKQRNRTNRLIIKYFLLNWKTVILWAKQENYQRFFDSALILIWWERSVNKQWLKALRKINIGILIYTWTFIHTFIYMYLYKIFIYTTIFIWIIYFFINIIIECIFIYEYLIIYL